MKTQMEIDALIMLKDHEGWSSGELSIEVDETRENIKGWMRYFEKQGYGTFTIQDGMYHFWFSPFGNETVTMLKALD